LRPFSLHVNYSRVDVSMEPPETITTFMEDGCVSVTVGHLTGVVSSAHLVEPKENQLRQRWLEENAIHDN
jgi:hypothetical protein